MISLDYYDMVLGGIFASLILGVGVGFLTELPMQMGLGFGAFPSLMMMYHGMFTNAPAHE